MCQRCFNNNTPAAAVDVVKPQTKVYEASPPPATLIEASKINKDTTAGNLYDGMDPMTEIFTEAERPHLPLDEQEKLLAVLNDELNNLEAALYQILSPAEPTKEGNLSEADGYSNPSPMREKVILHNMRIRGSIRYVVELRERLEV